MATGILLIVETYIDPGHPILICGYSLKESGKIMLKKSTPMSKMKIHLFNRYSIDRFPFKGSSDEIFLSVKKTGQFISHTDTVESLGLVNGDILICQ